MVALTAVLLPLYIYPTSTSWNFIKDSLSAYPSLPFTVIVNPSSGPGDIGSLPDDGYIDAVAELRAHTNVKLWGYVDTSFTEVEVESVTGQVDTYNLWNTYTEKDIHLDGIFFDDVVSDFSSSALTYMNTICASAHQHNLTVTLNPGTAIASQYYALADNIIQVESDYTSYDTSNGETINNVKAADMSNSSVIIYDFSDTEQKQDDLVRGLVQKGVSSIFIGTAAYEEESGLWNQFVDAVNRTVFAN